MSNKTIDDISHALKMAQNRLQWYSVTGDRILLEECAEWNSIAENYMNKLIVEQKYESCESTN